MVCIEITQLDDLIIANCHKGTKDGGYFQLIVDTISKECISYPKEKDIDVSVTIKLGRKLPRIRVQLFSYSRIYHLLKDGKPLPKEISAEWG